MMNKLLHAVGKVVNAAVFTVRGERSFKLDYLFLSGALWNKRQNLCFSVRI
jgi:hypothetical protein